MSVENTAAKPPETPAKPVEGQQAAPPATPAAPAAPTAKSFSAEDLSKFMARFGGEQGAKWLAEGKTYAEALELFATSQQDQLKESAAELSKKDETIKAMKLGHQSPAAFQGEGTNPTEQAAGADPAAAFANKIVGEFKKIRGES